MNQSWFEMLDLRKRKLDNSVWVPLRAEKSIKNDIGFGKVGYQDEFIGHGVLMVPIDKKKRDRKIKLDRYWNHALAWTKLCIWKLFTD